MEKMEVCVCAPRLRSSAQFPVGSVVKDVLTRFVEQQFGSPEDFYVIRNGRVSDMEDPLQHGAVYHLQPRLCGGKGGFGSMLRALGAQIEKTTNREACRDLSGRRLRDVNHEKEMAEWLKKQAEREAEKEQRRLDRLQRKLSEPKHQFTDPEYQRQCHDLSERLEDSVLLGLQASSSGHVRVEDVSATKRSNSDQSEQPKKKKSKKSSTCFWTGLEELPSSEDEDSSDSEDSSSSSACQSIRASENQEPPETKASEDQALPETKASEDQRPPKTEASKDQELPKTEVSEDQVPSETEAPENQEPPETKASEDQDPPETKASEDQDPPETKASEDQDPPETKASEDQEPPKTKASENQEPPKTKASEDQESPETKASEDQKPQEQQPLDLSSVSSIHQLESLGLDVLKLELMSRGLKCGGTLSERAARLFCVRGLVPEQFDPALLAKPGKSRRK